MESTVQVDDGAKLHVKLLQGDESTDKSKPLLIALHGAPGIYTHAEPEARFAHLSSLFRVLVYDARGSGDSDMTPPYSLERWGKDIDYLREWAWAETFVLIGHSYGGFVALDYAVNYPDRLRGLVLIDTWASGALGAMTALSYVLTSQRSKVDRARQVRFWSGTTLSDQDCRDAIGEMLPIDTPPEEGSSETAPSGTGDHQLFSTSAEFWGPRSRFRSVTHNWAFGQNLPRYDVRQRLDLIKAPTLVTVGRHDHVAPPSFAEEIAAGIIGARLEIFENSAHSPHADEPEKFNQILQDFLKTRIL